MMRGIALAALVTVAVGAFRPLPPQPRLTDVSGVITTPDGKPVAGVQVVAGRWVPPRGELADRQVLPISQPALTDAEGRYTIRGILPGPFLIGTLAWRWPVSPIGGASTSTGYETTFYPGATDAARAATLTADGTPFTDVSFAVRSARASDVTIRFAPTGSESARQAGAVLTPVSIPARFGNRNVATAAVRNGVHVFQRVPAGQYLLTHGTEQGWARQPVDVQASGPANELLVRLRPYFSVAGTVELHATNVRLTDETRPAILSAVSVSLNAVPAVGGAVTTARVSPDGRFVFSKLAGGDYVLLLSPNGGWRTVSGVLNGRESLDEAVRLEADVHEARVVIADRETSIYGLVRDAQGQFVLSGTVIIFSADPAHWGDQSGRRVRSVPVGPTAQYGTIGMAPGRYLVTYLHPDELYSREMLVTAAKTAVPFELGIAERTIHDVVVGTRRGPV